MQYLSTDWSTHSEALTQIRVGVFVDEQQVPIADEWDGKDEDAIHFLVQAADGTAIGCARLLVEGQLLHIGRVAVLAPWRKRGVGRKLMRSVLAYCAARYPGYHIYLHAQTSRVEFYKRLGFNIRGDEFMDAGIPHIEMWFDHQEGFKNE